MARIVEKDPDVDATFTIDWTNQIGALTISTSTWTVPAGITEGTSSNTSSTASVTLSGGTEGTTYAVTNDVTLSDASTLDATIYVYLKQQVLDESRPLPVSLQELKHYLRVTSSDDDENIHELLQASIDFAESQTGRSFISKTSTIYVPRFPTERRALSRTPCDDDGFEIRQTPVRAVARIRYYDSDNAIQTLSTDVYNVVNRSDGSTLVELAVGQSWPATADRGDAVEILLVSGYGRSDTDVPPMAKRLIKMVARQWYDNPDGAFPMTPTIDAMIADLKTGYYPDPPSQYETTTGRNYYWW